MPYISDAELERARWMTLAEAVAHVEVHDGCDPRSALEQLCNAICDRKLRTKWEDRKWFDWEPGRASFWARICIRDAKVADPETGEWRTVLVLKDDVLRIWPEPSLASAGSGSAKAGPTTVPLLRGKAGRKSLRDKIEEKLSGVKPMNLADAARHLWETWSDDGRPRPHVDTIRKHLRKIRDDKTQQN